jgi:argininosuccinate lyase
VPFRKAHEIIGNAVRLGLETGRELNELKLEELRSLARRLAKIFFAAITLEATLDCHDVVGWYGAGRGASVCCAALTDLSAATARPKPLERGVNS